LTNELCKHANTAKTFKAEIDFYARQNAMLRVSWLSSTYLSVHPPVRLHTFEPFKTLHAKITKLSLWLDPRTLVFCDNFIAMGEGVKMGTL